MTFDIRLDDYVYVDPSSGTDSREGEIVIDDFRERFVSLQSFWSASRYEAHWREAVERIVRDGERSCLITSIADPARSEMLFWWPMYREHDRVYVQNGMLFFGQLQGSFDPENPFPSVPDRTMINEDGERVSEWSLPVSDLQAFLLAPRPAMQRDIQRDAGSPS